MQVELAADASSFFLAAWDPGEQVMSIFQAPVPGSASCSLLVGSSLPS